MTERRGADRFASVLQDAISGSGLTLEAVQRRLSERGIAVGRSTLSYWQNGRRMPTGSSSIAVVEQLEQVLRVPQGSLVEALDEFAPPSPLMIFDMVSTGPNVDALIDQLGCREDFLASECVGSVNTGSYGPKGELVTMHTAIAVRALADIDRLPFLHGGELGGDPHLLHMEVLGGGRMGRLCRDDASNLIVGEVIFDRQVRRGESHLIQYLVRDDNHLPAQSHFLLVNFPRVFLAMELAFHPDCLPVRIEEFERVAESGPDLVSRNRLLGSDRKVALVRERARRGVVGMRWMFA